MALSEKKARWVSLAIMCAKVVFPVPGGPQKISEGVTPFSICMRRAPFSPTR